MQLKGSRRERKVSKKKKKKKKKKRKKGPFMVPLRDDSAIILESNRREIGQESAPNGRLS